MVRHYHQQHKDIHVLAVLTDPATVFTLSHTFLSRLHGMCLEYFNLPGSLNKHASFQSFSPLQGNLLFWSNVAKIRSCVFIQGCD